MARKILLADDSVTAQNMGRRILTDAGYEVITVNNGSAAMKKVAEIKPDLIILDVYMPGYGGLEICQRIRETPELARIPVLLTVGKLEPFRADDAKRVRADAFLIKPFEASELLTALTKLEDKIVPSGQPFVGSAGRFARAVASIEEAKTGKEFGDTDTGWKSRLKIPAPYSKPHEAHHEAQAEVPAAKPEAPVKPEVKETDHVASILPPEIASALPQDVTPEEIQAITAAAALLASHAEAANASAESPEAHVTPQPETAVPEESTRISAMLEDEPSENVPSIADFAPPVEIPLPQEAAAQNEEPQALVPPPEDVREDEFAAALATLSPVSDKAHTVDVEEAAPVTMAAAGGAEYHGPRWTAEETPVTEEESTLVLELEMERAYAAFAAADAARMFLGDSRYSGFSNEAEPAPVEKVSDAEIRIPATLETSPVPESSSEVSEPSPEIQSPEIKSEEAPAVPEPEPVVAEAISDAVPAAEPEEKAAYAAAGAGSSSVSSNETAPPATDSVTPTSISEPQITAQQSELAAAWASWKQFRETTSAAKAEASPGFRDFRNEPAGTAESGDSNTSDETSAEASEEASEVASIVDSVLADLKPKLMKEIAQKMGKGKKKKKKD